MCGSIFILTGNPYVESHYVGWNPTLNPLISDLGMGQNPIPLVNIKIAGKWMFIPLKMVCIGIDP